MGSVPSVAAAVVTYNRCDVLRTSLMALADQSRQLDAILVVDNASTDGTAEMVAREFPAVQLVRLPENTGAAGGFAAGIQEAVAQGYDWAWVFNDDDVAEPDALATMLDAVERLPPSLGVLGCGRRGAYEGIHPLGAKWAHRHVLVHTDGSAAPPVPLDVVTLSGTLVSASAVTQIGVPKAEYFMMIEDLEYCLRARRAGWDVYAVPQVLTTSLNLGSDRSTSPWRGYYQSRNQLAMTLDHRSGRELFWWSVRTAKFCIGAIRANDQPVARIRLRALGAWHALRHVSGRTIAPPATTAS